MGLTREEIRPGQTCWHVYWIPGSGPAGYGQRKVVVVQVGQAKAKVRREGGKESWVNLSNLRPTP